MPTKTKESSKTLMQKHLDRARDLGVELAEYSEAYGVDLDELKTANGESLLSNFVAVKIDTPPAVEHRCLCSISTSNGNRLELHERPLRATTGCSAASNGG